MYFIFCESVYLDTTQENETNNKLKNGASTQNRACFENDISTIHKDERYERTETNISQCVLC